MPGDDLRPRAPGRGATLPSATRSDTRAGVADGGESHGDRSRVVEPVVMFDLPDDWCPPIAAARLLMALVLEQRGIGCREVVAA